MDTIFIYNGKTYTTPNLEKKLKRMKITKDDIQIIDKEETKKKKLIKELRHLDGCIEANYSRGLQVYYYSEEVIPSTIGDRKLISVKPFEEWAADYYE